MIHYEERYGYLSNYEKNMDVFNQLSAYQNDAIERGKKRLELLEKDNIKIISRDIIL